MMVKNETQDVVIFDYLVNFYFIYFLLHVEELSFCFHFFLLIAILIFLSLMIKKCGILYEKTAVRVGDDEWMISYEWLKLE